MLILIAPLLFAVLLLFLFSENQVAFLFSILTGTSVGIYQLYLILTCPRFVRFSSIMSLSLLLGYAASTALYASGVLLTKLTINFEYNFFGLHYTQADLSIALILVYFTTILLIFISRIERSIFQSKVSIAGELAAGKADFLIFAGFSLLSVAFITGDLGYMGTRVNESGNISIIGAMAFFITPVIIPIFATSIVEKSTKKSYFLFLILTSRP